MFSIKAKCLSGHRSKMIGLLGQQVATPVYFKTRFGIHTFGLQFPIDILILDNNNQVIRISENIAPNSVFIWPPFFNRVVELPAGFIAHHQLHLKDTVSISIHDP
jgi:uncharacterized protein